MMSKKTARTKTRGKKQKNYKHNKSSKTNVYKYRNLKIFFIILFSFLFFISISLLIITKFMLFDIKSVPYNFTFSNSTVLGFDPSKDYLGFGKLPPGGETEKYIYISCPRKCFVSIKVEGTGKEYLEVNDNNFILYPNETKKLKFTLVAPENITHTTLYKGIIQFWFFSIP